jgi:hypothetical protein
LCALIDDNECPHSVRLGAIRECLNRALGLPVQYVQENINVRYQPPDSPSRRTPPSRAEIVRPEA